MTRLPGYHLLEPQEVAFRAICLGAAIQKDQLLAVSHQTDKPKNGQKVSRRDREESQKMLAFALSNELRKFIVCRPDTYDPVVIHRWAVNQLAVYLWSLGVIDQKPLVEVTFTAEELCAKIPLTGNLASFVEIAELRSIAELYPLELTLDLYGYRIGLSKYGEGFDEYEQERTQRKAKPLLEQGYLVSAPSEDLIFHGQQIAELDPFELEQIYELTDCRKDALFYVFGKMPR